MQDNVFRKRLKISNPNEGGTFNDPMMSQRLFNTVANKSSIKLTYSNSEFVPKKQTTFIPGYVVEQDVDFEKFQAKTPSTSANNSHVGSNNSSRNSWTGQILKKPICKAITNI
jgi:hypothetical protein